MPEPLVKWNRPDPEGIVRGSLPGVQIEREDADTDYGRRVQYIITTEDSYATARTLGAAKALVEQIARAAQVASNA